MRACSSVCSFCATGRLVKYIMSAVASEGQAALAQPGEHCTYCQAHRCMPPAADPASGSQTDQQLAGLGNIWQLAEGRGELE